MKTWVHISVGLVLAAAGAMFVPETSNHHTYSKIAPLHAVRLLASSASCSMTVGTHCWLV